MKCHLLHFLYLFLQRDANGDVLLLKGFFKVAQDGEEAFPVVKKPELHKRKF